MKKRVGMQNSVLIVMALLSLGLGGLSGCLSPSGSVDITISPRVDFDLGVFLSKQRMTFKAGQVAQGSVDYNGVFNDLHLKVDGKESIFKNIQKSEDGNSFTSSPTNSGQSLADGTKLGTQVSRSLICNPDCSHTTVSESTEACQIPYTCWREVCTMHGHGTQECYPEESTCYRTGMQNVEITRTLYNYDVEGGITSEYGRVLADLSGHFSEVTQHTRPTSPCL